MTSRYSERVKESVESLINCMICTDRFSHPKVLPCQHTFCLPCLERAFSTYNDQRIITSHNFPCPQCRKLAFIPPGGLTQLPTDFKVGQIEDVLSSFNILSEIITCDVCRHDNRNQSANSFCSQCSKYFCADCSEQHNNSTLFAAHASIALGGSDVNEDEMVCVRHSEAIKFYCAECRCALCTVCALTSHSKHDTVDLATASDRHRAHVTQIVTQLREKLTQTQDAAQRLAALSREQRQHGDALKAEVRQRARNCIAKLREDEQRMCASIDDVTSRVITDIDSEIESMRRRARELKTLRERGEALAAHDASMTLINKYDALVTSTNNLTRASDVTRPEAQNLYEKVTVTFNDDVSIGRVEIPQSNEHSDTEMTDIQDNNTDSTSPPMTTPSSSPRPTTTHLAGQEEGACAAGEDVKAKDRLRLLWRTVDNAQSRDVAFRADGSLVVTEAAPDSQKLQLFDSDGNLSRCVSRDDHDLVRPWGCSVDHQSGDIYVTDQGDGHVKVFSDNLSPKSVWPNKLRHPSGITVMRNGNVVISDVDSERHLLSIYTSCGVRVRDFAPRGDGLASLKRPLYVTSDSLGRIIATDAELRCVKVFDSRGKLLLKFEAAQEPHLQPHGVCVDAHNNIAVADQSNNIITLFSSDGQFIKNVAQVHERPWGLAAHDNGSLAITTDPSLHVLYAPVIRTL